MSNLTQKELLYLAECFLNTTIFNYTKEVAEDILKSDIELYNKMTGKNLSTIEIRSML